MPQPRIEFLTESQRTFLKLDTQEQDALRAAGMQLAVGTGRYGIGEASPTASLVSVETVNANEAWVTVRDAIGMLATPSVVLHVQPKIPSRHLSLLLASSVGVQPRMGAGYAGLAEAADLVLLVCRWFIKATEKLLEYGLAQDYRPTSDALLLVRGRIDPLRTTAFLQRGQVRVQCDFEEFDVDSALNRVIRAALLRVVAGAPLPRDLRADGSRCLAHMGGVSDLQPRDLMVGHTDTRTRYYSEALALAKWVLSSTGRDVGAGHARSWTFLIRTPAAVQSGIHAILAGALAPRDVRARRLRVDGLGFINPDLAFGDPVVAVADVKYKVGNAEWTRADVYQVTAYAAGFDVRDAALIRFATDSGSCLPDITLGRHQIRDLIWRAGPDDEPNASAANLVDDVANWLTQQPNGPQRENATGIAHAGV